MKDYNVKSFRCNANPMTSGNNLVPYSRENNLLLYTSSDDQKQSYHVLINGLYHSNWQHAKAFYNLIMSRIKIKPEYRKCIDAAVYNQNQAFRMIESSKLNQCRWKRIHPWTKCIPFECDDNDPEVRTLRWFVHHIQVL